MNHLKNGNTPPCTLVIFGASGDLTERKLIPALHSLDCENLLPPALQVLGVARTPLSDEEFREKVRQGVKEHGRFEPEVWEPFAERLHYLPGSYADPETFRELEDRLKHQEEVAGTQGNYMFYLAIPPVVYSSVIRQLGEAGLNRSDTGWSRIVIEKPFGTDLESARQLNEEIHEYFDESQVYRIDHYLGEESVQNILAFRFANFIFEEMWNRNFIDHIQISALEAIGIEHRGEYYEKSGVVRDMVQNHLLQLLSLTTMDPPMSLEAKALRDEKLKVLQAIKPLQMEQVVLGQYTSYRKEPDVAPDSNTPTYAALKVYVDSWRWQGTPFYLRAGKCLARKATEIVVQFKQVPKQIFPENRHLEVNHLSLCIQPDEGTHLSFELKVPGAGMRTKSVEMDFHYEEYFGQKALPEAYERLLLDALQGDQSLFGRSDEIEQAWELVTPLLKEWEGMENPPLIFYEDGSLGPEKSKELIERDGRTWLLLCSEHPKPPEEERM